MTWRLVSSPPADPTLTSASLTQLLGDVKHWDSFHDSLHIPDSVYEDIISQHSTDSQHVQELCEWYLENHPAPSWLHVADGLYSRGEHDILKALRSKVQYLKGKV